MKISMTIGMRRQCPNCSSKGINDLLLTAKLLPQHPNGGSGFTIGSDAIAML